MANGRLAAPAIVSHEQLLDLAPQFAAQLGVEVRQD